MKEKIRWEVMTEILESVGVKVTEEQIKTIVADFSHHIEMEHEMDSYQHVGHKEECSKCKTLESKLTDAEKQVEIYRNSVKKRRNTDQVWTEGDTVMYGGR